MLLRVSRCRKFDMPLMAAVQTMTLGEWRPFYESSLTRFPLVSRSANIAGHAGYALLRFRRPTRPREEHRRQETGTIGIVIVVTVVTLFYPRGLSCVARRHAVTR
jgi:hypothetical protein